MIQIVQMIIHTHERCIITDQSSAYIMPMNRYPVAVGGAYDALNTSQYSVVFDILRAVQYYVSDMVNTRSILLPIVGRACAHFGIQSPL